MNAFSPSATDDMLSTLKDILSITTELFVDIPPSALKAARSSVNDKKALESQANTLEELTPEKYAMIRSGYANKKSKNGQIDFGVKLKRAVK